MTVDNIETIDFHKIRDDLSKISDPRKFIDYFNINFSSGNTFEMIDMLRDLGVISYTVDGKADLDGIGIFDEIARLYSVISSSNPDQPFKNSLDMAFSKVRFTVHG